MSRGHKKQTEQGARPERNQLCDCGSKKKYKKCCEVPIEPNRQPTPMMELQCVVMSLEGEFLNWTEGLTSRDDVVMSVLTSIARIKSLYPDLEAGRFLRGAKD